MINRRSFVFSSLLPILFCGAKLADRKIHIKVGDIVINKIFGPKIVGKVIEKQNHQDNDIRDVADKIYPDWKSKHIFIVELDNPVNPVKPMTLQECINNGNSIQDYDNMLKYKYLSYPEDDLVKIG